MALKLESKIQRGCVAWFHFQYPTRLIYAIPNGGYRRKIEAAIMQGEGVKAGVPDLCIPEPIRHWHGLYIEMKVRGNRPKTNQKEWLAALSERGYRTEVVYNLDEFIHIVNDYFGDKRRPVLQAR